MDVLFYEAFCLSTYFIWLTKNVHTELFFVNTTAMYVGTLWVRCFFKSNLSSKFEDIWARAQLTLPTYIVHTYIT